MATNNSVNLKSAGITTYDGAGTFGAISVTQHAVPVGGANAESLTSLSVGTNGQLLIGSSAADPVFATLGTTGGLSITTGAGTLTINGTGGALAWSVISADQVAATNHGYFANKGSVLTLTLPTTTVVGDVIALVNINGAAFGKILSANPGTINLGSSVCTANTGSLTSTALGDAIFLVAQTTASVWYAYGVQGNWTVA